MPSIILDNVSVDLPIYDGASRSFRRALLSPMRVGGTITRDRGHMVVRALAGISVELRDGDRLGLIGHNGAGKSTLLRVMGGIYEPTGGVATITGRTSSLLDMSSILDPEMTGFENIERAPILLGLPGRDGQWLRGQVEEFTGLGEFLHMPVKTYSSGMRVRLSFALLTAQEPEILLLDEALGAGDAGFVQKATDRARHIRDNANIVVFASHALGNIRAMCNKVMWLEHGRIRGFGAVDPVLADYQRAMAETS